MADRARAAGANPVGGLVRSLREPAVGALLAAAASLPAILLGGAAPAGGQEPAAAVADEYLRGIEAGAWRATAQRIHPDALKRLRRTLRILTEPDSGDRLLDALSGGQPADQYFSLDGGSLFVSVMQTLERESPGIVNAMSDRDTEVLGAVAEGDTLRHAVYRLHWRLSGAEPEIETVTLALDDRNRWRILHAPELESLRPALRGLVVQRPPPSGDTPPDEPGAGSAPPKLP